MVAGASVPTATVFSPDSQWLAVGYRDGQVKLCRMSDGQELLHFRLGPQAIRQLAVSGDAMTLVVRDAETSHPTLQFVQLTDLRSSLAELGLAW